MSIARPAAELIALPGLDARPPLSLAVSAALRDAITVGALPPGARLREVALARHFGISPTPVREALRQLEREGLVEVSPHRGATVVAFTAEELANLYEIHEVLQCRAVRRAAEASASDFARLDALLAAMARVLGEPDQTEFNRLDLAFHRTLNDLGGNSPLAALTEQIHRRIQSQRIRLAVNLPDRPHQSHAEHQLLLDAVRAGDAALAEERARDHVRHVRDAFLRLLHAIEGGNWQ